MLSYQMEAGVNIGLAHETETISESYTYDIKESAEDSYSYDISVETTYTCTGKDGVGLYQWVVETADGLASSFTMNTLCRYGANHRTEPVCPYNACVDLECTICTGDWQAEEQE